MITCHADMSEVPSDKYTNNSNGKLTVFQEEKGEVPVVLPTAVESIPAT